MKLTIDTDARTVTLEDAGRRKTLDLYSKEAFEAISREWVRVGWNQKYQYTFSWMGRPVIQIPEDLVRIQEVIYRLKPDVIIETGVAHGGSLTFFSSLCKAMGRGRVVGVDIEIRPHNRRDIESHELSSFITLIEGDSVSREIVEKVQSLISPNDTALVLLDSNHSKAHVLRELDAYHGLVTVGSYIVATDGVMEILADVPRGKPEWSWDNPRQAAIEFSRSHPEFVIEQPHWPFNESELAENITHWPGAWLKRVK